MRLEKNNSECLRSASEKRKMYSQQYSLVVSLFSSPFFSQSKITENWTELEIPETRNRSKID